MKTYCLALDLRDDSALIEEYKHHHRPQVIWPEVVDNIKGQGIVSEEIFLLGTRMVMVLQTTDDFSFEEKAAPGEKWVLMEKIFAV